MKHALDENVYRYMTEYVDIQLFCQQKEFLAMLYMWFGFDNWVSCVWFVGNFLILYNTGYSENAECFWWV